jgi:hypothetical protein
MILTVLKPGNRSIGWHASKNPQRRRQQGHTGWHKIDLPAFMTMRSHCKPAGYSLRMRRRPSTTLVSDLSVLGEAITPSGLVAGMERIIAIVTFDLYALRFTFRAIDSLYFPQNKSANILRGGFGLIFRKLACVPQCQDTRSCELRTACAYARLFEPSAIGAGPSGLADWPRPFVFRAHHLDGQTIHPGEQFHFDVNLFDLEESSRAYLALTFAELAREGLGPGRGRAELLSAEGPRLCLTMQPDENPVQRVRVHFVTPTELKSGSQLVSRPEFPVLFGRLRDRVSTLRSLYGDGPLEIDFRALGERAAAVRTTRCDVRAIEVERRSSRTGQVHSLGGFVGSAEYEGDLAEFLPFLRAGQYTGVGRQTTWGKGEISLTLVLKE